ncbi:bifunctional cobalt-precorrin-7 (C(5))-methyltransferase/cobalt-precorrin-6B (C(15))-methyltransferase [Nitrospira moscoviensis]|jgi:precorrin-6Y C5,15-methyltransferase (decarboxylating)|uniref:Precorrin-6Y C(5,15)-methyltransferase (Decarboxylating) n=1 Tax=Nitrospira moscoviensis TaxID=42253 RepID=A0A0K2GAP8_NITMO|nr:bifunctional cobalt-precorrin-7 (C(5))-methyltransferase/cobalt-precorrin-6B (C(15))-methyltransferase [Nitrospira moscoviensis]ALA58020.1 Precorrin-6Y C(5,15)-methyltransferase (Decarboxylating) [Nitrospira moscoviensis]MDI3461513.1 cobalt-precorrin-6B C15-methyltransferase [decarboxylating] [Nitrospira sp.]
MSPRRAITLVGIGDDGCVSLTSRAVSAVTKAGVLVGGERHLEFFPQFHGERIVLKGGLSTVLDRVAELAEEQNVCVLASGDPMFFGIGGLVIKRLGAEHVEILPQPSSVQWAFARAGLKWDDAAFLSLHGRSAEGFLTRLKRHAKVAILTDENTSPPVLARRMTEHGETAWIAWVCENLGGPDERVRRFTVEDLAACQDIGPLNVLLLVRSDPSWRVPCTIPFLHEDAFAKRMPKKGLITKREVRLLSLAAMGIRPDSVIWDIGAGSGSVSVEAALLAPEGRVYAIEVDQEGVEMCRENLRAHAVDNVRVIAGRAPEVLADLEPPDAVFVGGSKGSIEEIIDIVFDRLQPGGHLVVNAITLENAGETYQVLRRRGLVPEVTLLQVSRAEPLAHYLRYEALNPIQIFAVSKPIQTGVAS